MRELDYEKVGMRIRQLRKAKGWSQSGLAEKCGISMSFLGHIERGSRIMSMETFANICLALEAGADELLWGMAGPSDAVLDIWNQPGKKKEKAGHQDADMDKNKKKKAHKNIQEDKKAASGEGSRNMDSYAMYVKIMKSVAEIMNEA